VAPDREFKFSTDTDPAEPPAASELRFDYTPGYPTPSRRTAPTPSAKAVGIALGVVVAGAIVAGAGVGLWTHPQLVSSLGSQTASAADAVRRTADRAGAEVAALKPKVEHRLAAVTPPAPTPVAPAPVVAAPARLQAAPSPPPAVIAAEPAAPAPAVEKAETAKPAPVERAQARAEVRQASARAPRRRVAIPPMESTLDDQLAILRGKRAESRLPGRPAALSAAQSQDFGDELAALRGQDAASDANARLEP
jgi:hypothetical protein